METYLNIHKAEKDSMQNRLDNAGVETIRPEGKYNAVRNVKLRYNGKTIERPHPNNCIFACKKAFGIDI